MAFSIHNGFWPRQAVEPAALVQRVHQRLIQEIDVAALHLVVQLARFRDGRWRVSTIAEITGIEGDAVAMQDLFRFEQTGVDSQSRVLGDLAPTGVRPTFADALEQAGVDFDWGSLAARS